MRVAVLIAMQIAAAVLGVAVFGYFALFPAQWDPKLGIHVT